MQGALAAAEWFLFALTHHTPWGTPAHYRHVTCRFPWTPLSTCQCTADRLAVPTSVHKLAAYVSMH